MNLKKNIGASDKIRFLLDKMIIYDFDDNMLDFLGK